MRTRLRSSVVALVAGAETTLKRFYREPEDMVRLQPANSALEPILVPAGQVDPKWDMMYYIEVMDGAGNPMVVQFCTYARLASGEWVLSENNRRAPRCQAEFPLVRDGKLKGLASR